MKNVKKLSLMALMAALSYISFAYLQIKIPTIGGYTSFHLGNTFVLLGALLLDGFSGGLSGAIGMAIGDLFDPVYVMVVPKTIILKLGIGLVCGFFAHKVFKIREKSGKALANTVVFSSIAGMLFNVICEPFVSYFYTCYILNAPQKAAMALASYNALTTSVNAIISVIIASILYFALVKSIKNEL